MEFVQRYSPRTELYASAVVGEVRLASGECVVCRIEARDETYEETRERLIAHAESGSAA
jgi:hypothetical protein